MMLFRPIVKGTGESGLKSVNKKLNSFMESPTSIRNALLRPIEKRMVSTPSSSFNFSSLTMTKPGRKVKYTNPITCLATGRSTNIVRYIVNCRSSMLIAKLQRLNFAFARLKLYTSATTIRERLLSINTPYKFLACPMVFTTNFTTCLYEERINIWKGRDKILGHKVQTFKGDSVIAEC